MGVNPERALTCREALVAIMGLLEEASDTGSVDMKGIQGIAETALSAPRRNCDVFSANRLKEDFRRELAAGAGHSLGEDERKMAVVVADGVIDSLFENANPEEGAD